MTDTTIKNAQIKSTFLGREDHGIFTFYLDVCIADGGCAIGGYALDNYDETQKRRICDQKGLQLIDEIIRVVGVDSWEKLNGKYIRIKCRGRGQTVNEIGNLIDDKWLNF